MIDKLDIQSETCPLSSLERDELRVANDQLSKLMREEESKWTQGAKVKHIQEGGYNTKYFHLIANGKHRKKKIFQLEQEEGTIVGDENLCIFINEYYKRLFGAPVQNNFSLDEGVTTDIPQISNEENLIITEAFNEEEVFEAIDQMEYNKAPGPDGFPAEFYKTFWHVIKNDLMAMFVQLHRDRKSVV